MLRGKNNTHLPRRPGSNDRTGMIVLALLAAILAVGLLIAWHQGILTPGVGLDGDGGQKYQS